MKPPGVETGVYKRASRGEGWARLRRWLKLPEYKNESDHLAAVALDAFLWLGLLAILVSVAGLWLFTESPYPNATLYIVSTLVVLTCLMLLRLGQVAVTGFIVVFGGWLIMARTTLIHDSFELVNLLGHLLLIFLGGLVLRPRTAFVLAGMSSLASLASSLTAPPLLPGEIPHHTPYHVITASVYFFMGAFLVFLARRWIEQNLARSRRNDLLYQALFRNMPEAVVLLDLEQRVIQANVFAGDMLGYSPEDLVGQRVEDLLSPASARIIAEYLPRVLERANLPVYEIELRHKSGHPVIVEISTALVLDEAGDPMCIQNIIRDVSGRKRAEKELLVQATTDPLTGLLNRAEFESILDRALGRAQREKNRLGLLFIDIDNLKVINDRFGHHTGDTYLREVADRLSHAIRGGDVLARLSGDEFVVLLEPLRATTAAEKLAERILLEIALPLELSGETLHGSCSIGISIFPHDGRDAIMLLRMADLAMYAAKNAGKNQYKFFNKVEV